MSTTTKATHTPGPWRVVNGSLFGCVANLECSPETTKSVFGIYHATKEERDANARLIAAAPEMLEALERCEAMVSTNDGPPDWDAIREVIRKARGEQ